MADDPKVSSPPERAAGGPEAALIVIRGEPFGKTFEIGPRPLSIGRSAACDIQFGEDNVSRRHCQIWASASGYWIADLGSTNPTRVNGQAIGRCRLKDGDRITVGNVIFKFIASEHPG